MFDFGNKEGILSGCTTWKKLDNSGKRDKGSFFWVAFLFLWPTFSYKNMISQHPSHVQRPFLYPHPQGMPIVWFYFSPVLPFSLSQLLTQAVFAQNSSGACVWSAHTTKRSASAQPHVLYQLVLERMGQNCMIKKWYKAICSPPLAMDVL